MTCKRAALKIFHVIRSVNNIHQQHGASETLKNYSSLDIVVGVNVLRENCNGILSSNNLRGFVN